MILTCSMCHCHQRQSCNEEEASLTTSLQHASSPPEVVIQWRTNIIHNIFTACVAATWGSHAMKNKHHLQYLCCTEVCLPPEAVMQWRANIILTISLLHVLPPPEVVMQWRLHITYHLLTTCAIAIWGSHAMMKNTSLTISWLHESPPPEEVIQWSKCSALVGPVQLFWMKSWRLATPIMNKHLCLKNKK